jgi:hypothetical protein
MNYLPYKIIIAVFFLPMFLMSQSTNNSSNYIQKVSDKNEGRESYVCGGTPCEGFNVSRHENGQYQIIGTFEKGFPIDTLKEFDETGQIIRLLHPDKTTGFEKIFYPNGQIKRHFNQKEAKCTYFYQNGNVWLNYTTEGGCRKNIVQYYENGKIRLEQEDNTQKAYYENGKLAYKCKRSEPYKMSRIINKDDFKYYTFQFESYNENGVKIVEAVFSATDMDYKDGFPASITEVRPTDFDNVIYYDASGQPAKKEVFEYVTEKRYKKTTFSYENGQWRELETINDKIN